MTKLSHIPMQIQKWIASLTHLFFLILGLTGICLMYIHGNFGLGLTGIGSVPYEDTAEFNTQFNNDLNDILDQPNQKNRPRQMNQDGKNTSDQCKQHK